MFSHSTFHFSSHYFWYISLQSDLCLWFGLCVTRIPVCQSCVNQRTVKVWMNGWGLFGFSGTFSLLLYCRIVLDLLYIFFLWGRGLGWHLLQYCDDYLKIVNCTEFTLYSLFFLLGFLIKYVFFNFVFSLSRLWKIQLYSSKSLSSPQHCFFVLFCFSELWLREILTVNKYYCVEIWMSLQKCIWMS